MKTIVLAGHKGGIGKTTLSILLANFSVNLKKKVALIDLDPQQSLYDWWAQRPDDDPLNLLDVDYKDLKSAQKTLSKQTDFLFIDTPPAHQDIIKSAIQVADIVIVPCGPSPLDIKGIGETITVLEKLKKEFFFVINRAISRTTIASESLPLLAQYGKVAPQVIGMRVDYAQGILGGHTPLDLSNKKINDEVKALYKYLEKQLSK